MATDPTDTLIAPNRQAGEHHGLRSIRFTNGFGGAVMSLEPQRIFQTTYSVSGVASHQVIAGARPARITIRMTGDCLQQPPSETMAPLILMDLLGVQAHYAAFLCPGLKVTVDESGNRTADFELHFCKRDVDEILDLAAQVGDQQPDITALMGEVAAASDQDRRSAALVLADCVEEQDHPLALSIAESIRHLFPRAQTL